MEASLLNRHIKCRTEGLSRFPCLTGAVGTVSTEMQKPRLCGFNQATDLLSWHSRLRRARNSRQFQQYQYPTNRGGTLRFSDYHHGQVVLPGAILATTMPRSVLFHQNHSTVYKTADATALDHQNAHRFWAVLPEWSNVEMPRGLALGPILHDPQLGRKHCGMVIFPKLSCEQLCTRMCSGLTLLKQVGIQLGLRKDVIFITTTARHIPNPLTFRFITDKEDFNIINIYLGDVISSKHPSIFISDIKIEAIKSVNPLKLLY
jgi:hypothetical protein